MHVYVDHLEHFECPVCKARIDCTDSLPFSETPCAACGSKVSVPGLFGHYTLLKRLGEGGTGPVYRAKDNKLNRIVALKVLHKVLSLNPELVEFFKNSARSAANLNHSNVMKIFELGKHDEQHFITMELIDGQNLRELLFSDTVSEEEVLHIGLGISQGLDAAHQTGLVHGDVRPKNIFINHEGIPKISDFGLARSISKGSSRPYNWVSPYYTAPERLQGGDDTVQTDMYGLGATLYQALVGRPPFDDPDTEKVLQLKNTFDVPDVREARPDLQPATAAIINRLLAREPQKRYASYADLIRAFQEALAGGEGSSAEAAKEELARTAPIGASTVPLGESAGEAEAAPAPARSSRGLAVAAVLLLIGGGGAYFAMRSNSSGPATPDRPPVPPVTPAAATNTVAVPTPSPVAPQAIDLPVIPPEPVASVPGLQAWFRDGQPADAAWTDLSPRKQAATPDAAAGVHRFAPPAATNGYTVMIAFRGASAPAAGGTSYRVLAGTGAPDQRPTRLCVFADRDLPGVIGYAVAGHSRPEAFEVKSGADAVHVLHVCLAPAGDILRITAGLDAGPVDTWELPRAEIAEWTPDPLSWFIGGLPGADARFGGSIRELAWYDRPLSEAELHRVAADLAARLSSPGSPAP